MSIGKSTEKKSSAGKSETKPRRSRATRFDPDPMTLAYFCLGLNAKFKPDFVGLVINESYTGCALVVASESGLKQNQEVTIKIGNLDPTPGEIIWVKTLENNIKKLGIKLLE